MGQDKAALRLGKRTMLGIIRATARSTGLPVRIIRRDLVPRCGPLGGVLTALMTSSAERILFLACDMPFVSAELLGVLSGARGANRPLFVSSHGRVGFPFILPRSAREPVQAQIENGELSLQGLAKSLKGIRKTLPRRFAPQLDNVNTPAKYACALNPQRL
jgi:molybdenum cofactor guanylyltransferase